MQRLKPLLPTLQPTLGYISQGEQDRNRYRYSTEPWRAWYGSQRWKRLRFSVCVRDLFTCQLCHRIAGRKGEAVADHKVPHRGNALLFWDEANLQCVCVECHDGVKQAQDKAFR